jgi:hypothetical protein
MIEVIPILGASLASGRCRNMASTTLMKNASPLAAGDRKL